MSLLSRVISKPVHFIEHQIARVKERIQHEISDKITKLILIVALAILLFFVILFASIGLAMYFNVLLKSFFWGYLMVAGIYLLLFVILLLIRKNPSLFRKSKQSVDRFFKSVSFKEPG